MQLTGIAAVVIVATLGCVPPSSQGRPAAAESVADTTPFTHVYEDALKRAVPSLSSQIDAASPSAIHVTPDTSRAMAVIYRWVVFVPTGSSDRFVQIVVAPAGGSVMELRSAADWKTLADRLGWQPETADQALRGCWDMIRSVGPRRNMVWPPVPLCGQHIVAQLGCHGCRDAAGAPDAAPDQPSGGVDSSCMVCRIRAKLTVRVQAWSNSGNLRTSSNN